jgi:D-alanine-D-alanine ligase
MRVVVLVDWEACRHRAGGIFETLEGTEQSFVAHGLQITGHEISVLPFESDIDSDILRLKNAHPDVVFNLTLSVTSNRRKSHAVAAILDLMELPYTGSDSFGLQICQDKVLSKQIVRSLGIDVPHFFSLKPNTNISTRNLQFPLIIKPRYGDSSEFLSKRSVVSDEGHFLRRVEKMLGLCKEPLICEEFIKGRDIYVSILGNEKPLILPPRGLRCDSLSSQAPQFETWRVKHDSKYRAKWKISYPRADLSEYKLQELNDMCKNIYRWLNLRDYARLDFRVTEDNEFKFLEANSHPDLSPGAFGKVCSWVGISYSNLLTRILRLALKRSKSLH